MRSLHPSLLSIACLTTGLVISGHVAAQPVPESPPPEEPTQTPEQGPDDTAPEGDQPPSNQKPGEADAPQTDAPPPGSAAAPPVLDTASEQPPATPPRASVSPPTAPNQPVQPAATPEGPTPAVGPDLSPAPDTSGPGPTWGVQPLATPVDTGVTDNTATSQKREKSRWRLSRLSLDQSVTANTVGVGQDYQTYNPTYDWTLLLRPRYYFIDRDNWRYSVQATVGAAQELTNSDGTTGRRQLDAEDTLLALRYDRTLFRSGRTISAIGLALPELDLPTSRGSRNNGRIMGVGGALIPAQQIPLAKEGPFFTTFTVAGLARYQHYLTRSTVPTHDELTRPRTDLNGRLVISDQLGAPAFPEHEARFGFNTELMIHERVALISDFQWRPTWSYGLDHEAEICDLLTGCAKIDSVDNPQTYQLITAFATEVEAQVMDELSVSVGYQNLANQIGPDGQRRNMFYSPNARFYLTLTAFLAEIFDKHAEPSRKNLTLARTRTRLGSPREF